MESQGVAQALRQWVAQLLETLLVATDLVLPHLTQAGTNTGELWLFSSTDMCCEWPASFAALLLTLWPSRNIGNFGGTGCVSGDLEQCSPVLLQADNCQCSPVMS